MLISIVIPTLNEEEGIGMTIDDIPIKELKKAGYEVEVLVIDGGSTDKTVEKAKSKGAKIIISKRGYGLQYRNGFMNVKGDIIATADGDASYPLRKLTFFLEVLMKRKLDFISVNRLDSIEKGAMPIVKKAGNIFLTIVTNFLFGLKLKDSQSGMWVFKKEALNKLRLVSDGMALSQEIKIEAFRKLRSIEIDGLYAKRIGGVKLKVLSDGFGNLLFLLKRCVRIL